MKKTESERHYVAVSRAATVVLFLLSIIVTWQLDTIAGAWKFLIGLGAGTGLVYMLRWYWWRINAWSEISAMIASFVIFIWLGGGLGLVLSKVGLLSDPASLTPAFIRNAGANTDPLILLITVLVTTVAWIAATFATAPEPKEVLKSFYMRVRPGGPGWSIISGELGFGTEPIAAGRHAWLNWLAGVVAVYASLFGIGKIIFGEWGLGIGLLAIAGAAFAWIAKALKAQDQQAASVA